MNKLRVSAGLVALVDSVLALYLSEFTSFPGTNAFFQATLLWAGAFLLVDSLLCIYGVHYAFMVAVLLTAVLSADSPLGLSGNALEEFALLGLSLLGLITNAFAYRSHTPLSEQANPMNLPVFG